MLTSFKRYGLYFAPMTPLFALTKRDKRFGAFAACLFETFLWGPCLYFTRGYIGFLLIKNHTPLAPVWTRESFPREEKSTGPSVHCADLHMRKRKKCKKKKNLPYKPLRLFSSGGFYTFPTRSTSVAYPYSMTKGLRCLLVCGACRPLALP